MGHGNNHASTWVIFIGYRDRFNIICIYSGAGVWLSDEGLAYAHTAAAESRHSALITHSGVV